MSNPQTETTLQSFNQERYDVYPEHKKFDEAWLDKIPAHWETGRFKSNIDYIKGNKPKKSENEKSPKCDSPYLSMDYLRGKISNPEFANSDEAGLIFATENDILLLWDGSKAGEFIRAKEGVISSTMAKLILREDINKNYIYYQLKVLQDYIQNTTVGMGIPHVNPKIVNNTNLIIPPQEEQKGIVRFLDRKTKKIDQLISHLEDLIGFIEEQRNTIIKDVVINGLNSDAEKKESGVDWVGEIPAHWDVPRIRFVARMESGHTPSKSEDGYWDGDIPWVSLADSGWMREHDYISETDKTISEEGLANSSAHILPSETMVFTRDATVGLCAITTREMAVSQHIIGWICEDNLHPEYLLNVTKAMDQELDRLTMGATISTVGMEDIKKLKMPLPPIEEQKEIVDYLNKELEKFDNSTEKIREGIERLKEYRTALITEAVTGQIDVRGEV
jgi:type I restriction enzyme S subunit